MSVPHSEDQRTGATVMPTIPGASPTTPTKHASSSVSAASDVQQTPRPSPQQSSIAVAPTTPSASNLLTPPNSSERPSHSVSIECRAPVPFSPAHENALREMKRLLDENAPDDPGAETFRAESSALAVSQPALPHLSNAASKKDQKSAKETKAPQSKQSPAMLASDPLSNPVGTNNVYINGLPPHMPEEQLFNIVRPYGRLISVKTFTRTVSDKPSGYGFAFFERREDAEECIKALRRTKDLHPSFSKQAHKIPAALRTIAPTTPLVPMSHLGLGALSTLASVQAQLAGSPLARAQTAPSFIHPLAASLSHYPPELDLNAGFFEQNVHDGHLGPEPLGGGLSGGVPLAGSPLLPSEAVQVPLQHPNGNVDVCVIGLPLHTDSTKMLHSLVAPQPILGSAYFQTTIGGRLRLVAFIRLNSMRSANDVVHRLNGRSVRGQQIMVRLATSALPEIAAATAITSELGINGHAGPGLAAGSTGFLDVTDAMLATETSPTHGMRRVSSVPAFMAYQQNPTDEELAELHRILSARESGSPMFMSTTLHARHFAPQSLHDGFDFPTGGMPSPNYPHSQAKSAYARHADTYAVDMADSQQEHPSMFTVDANRAPAPTYSFEVPLQPSPPFQPQYMHIPALSSAPPLPPRFDPLARRFSAADVLRSTGVPFVPFSAGGTTGPPRAGMVMKRPSEPALRLHADPSLLAKRPSKAIPIIAPPGVNPSNTSVDTSTSSGSKTDISTDSLGLPNAQSTPPPSNTPFMLFNSPEELSTERFPVLRPTAYLPAPLNSTVSLPAMSMSLGHMGHRPTPLALSSHMTAPILAGPLSSTSTSSGSSFSVPSSAGPGSAFSRYGYEYGSLFAAPLATSGALSHSGSAPSLSSLASSSSGNGVGVFSSLHREASGSPCAGTGSPGSSDSSEFGLELAEPETADDRELAAGSKRWLPSWLEDDDEDLNSAQLGVVSMSPRGRATLMKPLGLQKPGAGWINERVSGEALGGMMDDEEAGGDATMLVDATTPSASERLPAGVTVPASMSAA